MMWIELSVIGFAFIVNRFLLMPRLFFTKMYTQYVLSICGLLALISIFILYFDGVNIVMSLIDSDFVEYHRPREAMVPPPLDINELPPLQVRPTNTLIPPTVNVLILSALIIALDTSLNISTKWLILEHKEEEKKRKSVTAQLTNLQNQISPHFFMNTLNNIHALVEIDPTRAQKTIIELSGLMDYLLYESSNMDRVSLHRELEFTQNYINLMRLRYPKRVVIDFKHSGNEPKVEIPPLLFLNFIENTFKYGVDYTKESFIRIYFNFSSSHIEMIAQNSNHSATTKSARHGLGIENSLKRLKLLYGNSYTLEISDKEGVYSVTLKISI